MSSMIPTGANTNVLAIPTADGVKGVDASDEMDDAAGTFADLLRGVGQAVAETQSQMNENGVEMALSLVDATVPLIVAEQTIMDENGNLTESKVHLANVPMITYVDPVFQEWTDVRVMGEFRATEFKSRGSVSTTSGGSTVGVGASVKGGTKRRPSLKLGGSYEVSREKSDLSQRSHTETNRGRMRVAARIQPHAFKGVPAPTFSMRGPRLAISEGADSRKTTRLEGQEQEIHYLNKETIIQFLRRDGTSIQNKRVSLSVDEVSFGWAPTGYGLYIPDDVEDVEQVEGDGDEQLNAIKDGLDVEGAQAIDDFYRPYIDWRQDLLSNPDTAGPRPPADGWQGPGFTDHNGEIRILLNRQVLVNTGQEPKKEDFVVSARIGLVNNDTTVSF